MNRRQSSAESSEWIPLSWTVLGLLLLFGLPLLELDRTPFSPREGWNAVAITDVETLGQRSSALELPVGQRAIARAWFTFVGGPERPLRLLIPWIWSISMLLLAFGIRASLAPDPRIPRESTERSVKDHLRLQDRGFGLVLLVGALCPLVARRDLLHPELCAVFPVACVLSGVAWLRGRSLLWLVVALLGAALAPLFGPRAAAASLLSVVAVPLLLPAGPGVLRPAVFGLGAAGALVGVAAMRGWLPEWPQTPVLGPLTGQLGTSELLGSERWLRLLTWAPLLLLIFPQTLRELWKPCVILLSALLVLGQDFSHPQWLGADVAVTVPLMAWAVAWQQAQWSNGRWAQLAVAFALLCVFIAEWPAIAGHLKGTPIWSQSAIAAHDDPRTALRLARQQGISGGRLVIHGDQRFALAWYAAHGQNPGIPCLSIPEDTSLDSLAGTLRDQLRIEPKDLLSTAAGAKRDFGLLITPPLKVWPKGVQLLPIAKDEPSQALQRLELELP